MFAGSMSWPTFARRPVIVVLVSLVLLAACQPAAQTGRPPAQPSGTQSSEWDALVAAARQEGTVVVYGPPGPGHRSAILAFEQAYPGIKVEGVFGAGNDIVVRLTTERAADKYLPDVIVAGPGSLTTRIKAAGMVVPLEPALILPEVRDPSKWLQNELWWSDGEPHAVLQFQGNVGATAFYNTGQIDPSQFRSYWDFLDPRWKGKIVVTDIRTIGPGSTPATVMHENPDLGPAFFEKLFGEMDVTTSSDQRQMIDWLAQGQYPLGLFLSGEEVDRAATQGLPVGSIPVEQLREPSAVSSGFGCVGLPDRPPHPNAAKLFINWLLSRDGQIAWQREVQVASLRIDIPKDGIDAPKPDGTYVNGSLERYSTVTADKLRPMIDRVLPAR
jgi:iron(III) transport system substrate-binding protein